MEEMKNSSVSTELDGKVLPIIQYPSEVLTKASNPVVNDIVTDHQLQQLLVDLEATVRAHGAAGLAAVQVGYHVRALVVQDEKGNVTKVVNPRLVSVSEKFERTKEGCLSFRGLFIGVRRPAQCVVEYFDEKGVKQTTEHNGLLGRAIQHEIDHLDGKTFLDRLPNVERSSALLKNKAAKRRLNAAIKEVVAQRAKQAAFERRLAAAEEAAAEAQLTTESRSDTPAQP